MQLLGIDESGKSTITKQMRKILAKEPVSLHERKEARQIIFSNLKLAFRTIKEDMKRLGLEFEDDLLIQMINLCQFYPTKSSESDS